MIDEPSTDLPDDRLAEIVEDMIRKHCPDPTEYATAKANGLSGVPIVKAGRAFGFSDAMILFHVSNVCARMWK